MSRKPPDAVTKAWARLIRARETVVGAVERDLKAAGLPALSYQKYIVLPAQFSPGEALRC